MTDQGTILIVDDTPADLELLADTLTAEGYQVLVAESGEVALASVAARRPELILLDIRLPCLDGFEVCRRLKARPESRDIPIMFISVSGERVERLEGLKLGAVDYIAKPFHREELLTRVQTQLELGRLRVRLERQAANLRQANEQLRGELAERKRREEALGESELRYPSLFEHMLEGFAYCQMLYDQQERPVDFVYLEVNHAFGRLTGLENVVGKPVSEVIPGIRELSPELFESYSRVAATGKPEHFEFDFKSLNQWLSISVYSPKEGFFVAVFEDITERKRAEEELRAAQHILEKILNAIPVRVFWKDKNLVYLGCNAAFARDAGFADPKDLIGKDDFQMGWREQAELYRSDDRQVIENGCSKLLVEESQTTPEGNTITLLTNKLPLRGSKGEVSGVLGTYMDITEHKQAEEVLRQRVKLQDQLVHTAAALPGMIYSLLLRPDGSTRMPYVSGALSEIFDLQPKDVIADAAPIFSLIHPEDIGHVMATIAESARTLNPWRDDFRVRHARVGEIWVEGHSVPQREPDGGTLWHGFVQDITERKRMEERLEQSEDRMRAITDSAQDAILMMGPEGKVTYWNPAAERILGYARTEALGQNLHDLIAPARFHPAHHTAFPAFLQTGQGAAVGKTLDLVARRKDGQEITVQLSLSAVQMSGGWHAVGLMRDITERKQAEAALRRSEMKFRTLYDSTSDAVMLLDQKGFFDCNRATLTMFGCTTREEFCANHPGDVSPPWQPDGTNSGTLANQCIARAMAKGSYQFEWMHKRADTGETFPAEVLLNAMELDGKPTLQAVVRNITERKKTESVLAERARLSALAAEVGAALTKGASLHDSLQGCAAALVQHLDAAFARVWTLNAQTNVLELQASAGMYTHLDGAHGRVPVGKFKIGLIAQERKPHLTNQVLGDPLVRDQEWVKREAMVSFAGYPLMVDNRLLGVMALFARHPLPDPTLRTMAGIADNIALGIERMHGNVALRQSEARMRLQTAALESTANAVVITNVKGAIQWVNPAFTELTGYSPEEAIGQNPRLLKSGQQADSFYQDLWQTISNGHVWEGELINRRKDGQLCQESMTITPVLDACGTITHFIAIKQNISERKRAEEELREKEQLLSEAQRLGHIGSWFFDTTGPMRWSEELYRLYGVSPDTFTPTEESLVGLMHPDDRPAMQAWMAACAAGEKPGESEFRISLPDGTIRWIRGHGDAVHDAQNRLTHIAGTAQDITERKRVEGALREVEIRLAHAMSMAQLVAWEYDVASGLFIFSDRYYVLHGTTTEMEGGDRMSAEEFTRRFIHPDDAHLVGEEVGKAIASADPDYQTQLECRILRRDGEVRHVSVSISITQDAAGRTIQLHGANQDITERRRAQAELENLHKQLLDASRQAGMAEIATNVLHNVGNVLNSVNISTGLLVESVKQSRASSLGRVVSLLQEHAQDLGEFITHDPRGKHLPAHLAQLSEHLLAEKATNISELDSLRRNVEHIKEIVAMQQNYATFGGIKEMINVADLVEDSLRLNAGAFNRHDVEVIREFETVPPLNLEKHKFLQIMVNLLRNAKHACQDSARADKRLTVRMANGNGWIRISVIDNGVGIPPENLTRIFNHGFTTRKGGHGFGLHSGALAAKEMGGSLTVHSAGPGQGAAFILELPCDSGKTES